MLGFLALILTVTAVAKASENKPEEKKKETTNNTKMLTTLKSSNDLMYTGFGNNILGYPLNSSSYLLSPRLVTRTRIEIETTTVTYSTMKIKKETTWEF